LRDEWEAGSGKREAGSGGDERGESYLLSVIWGLGDYKTEDRDQRTEIRGQRSEDRGQRSGRRIE
jgi:hypothetical protein